ncbi:MAG: hypothetical protein MJ072_01580, partial [Clostridia bacterium]|nr:hypothetical protein [Clostridia bacterium]
MFDDKEKEKIRAEADKYDGSEKLDLNKDENRLKLASYLNKVVEAVGVKGERTSLEAKVADYQLVDNYVEAQKIVDDYNERLSCKNSLLDDKDTFLHGFLSAFMKADDYEYNNKVIEYAQAKSPVLKQALNNTIANFAKLSITDINGALYDDTGRQAIRFYKSHREMIEFAMCWEEFKSSDLNPDLNPDFIGIMDQIEPTVKLLQGVYDRVYLASKGIQFMSESAKEAMQRAINPNKGILDDFDAKQVKKSMNSVKNQQAVGRRMNDQLFEHSARQEYLVRLRAVTKQGEFRPIGTPDTSLVMTSDKFNKAIFGAVQGAVPAKNTCNLAKDYISVIKSACNEASERSGHRYKNLSAFIDDYPSRGFGKDSDYYVRLTQTIRRIESANYVPSRDDMIELRTGLSQYVGYKKNQLKDSRYSKDGITFKSSVSQARYDCFRRCLAEMDAVIEAQCHFTGKFISQDTGNKTGISKSASFIEVPTEISQLIESEIAVKGTVKEDVDEVTPIQVDEKDKIEIKANARLIKEAEDKKAEEERIKKEHEEKVKKEKEEKEEKAKKEKEEYNKIIEQEKKLVAEEKDRQEKAEQKRQEKAEEEKVQKEADTEEEFEQLIQSAIGTSKKPIRVRKPEPIEKEESSEERFEKVKERIRNVLSLRKYYDEDKKTYVTEFEDPALFIENHKPAKVFFIRPNNSPQYNEIARIVNKRKDILYGNKNVSSQEVMLEANRLLNAIADYTKYKVTKGKTVNGKTVFSNEISQARYDYFTKMQTDLQKALGDYRLTKKEVS